MLPAEDELEVLDHDIRQAERRLDDLGRERARVVSEPEISQAMWRLQRRLTDMREERDELAAKIAAEEELVA